MFKRKTFSLNACHTRRLFHCVATELFKFPEHRENARKSWYFSWKIVSHGVLTATKALPRSSHGVLSCSYGVHGGDSLCSQGAFTARPRRSQRMRHFFTALPLRWRRVEDAVTSPRKSCSLRANATDDHGVCTTTLVCAHGALICVVGDLTAQLWWPYGVPSALY